MICATHTADRPLVVQFAVSNADDFGRAAEMVAPYADAVDLNCGCPQRSAGQPLPLGGGGGGGGGGEGGGRKGGEGRKEGRRRRRRRGRGVGEEREGGGRGEGRGAARRSEGGRAREQSSHCPSFAVSFGRSTSLEKKLVTSNSSLCHRWAMAEGIGAHLISKPELVCDMVQSARSRSGLPVSIKIRVHKDLR